MQPTALSISEISALTGAYTDPEHSSVIIKCASALNSNNCDAISFYNGAFEYLAAIQSATVRACFVTKENATILPKGVITLTVQDPYLAITQTITKMYGSGEDFPHSFLEIETLKTTNTKYKNISHRANISSEAIIGENVTIMAGAYIGCGVIIGSGTTIHSNASLEKCTVGKNCVIRSGARIGSSGFGFVPDFKSGKHIPIPQISRTILNDEVDIGANSCVDRGFLTDTTIGSYTKIDNAVHIGHGVTIGKSCFFAGGTVVAGSCIIGNCCMIGGQSAIANNVILPDFTKVLGMSGIAKGPKEKGKSIIGSPAMDHMAWKRIHAYLLKVGKNSGK